MINKCVFYPVGFPVILLCPFRITDLYFKFFTHMTRWVGHVVPVAKMRICSKFWLEVLKGRRHFED
jgi:hypothetical protein